MLFNRNQDPENPFRQRYRRLPELVLLGLGTGTVTAFLIILFRWLLELPNLIFSFSASYTGLSELPAVWRFLIPLTGSALLWIYWKNQSIDSRRVGIAHIHERMSHHHGELPLRNLINQLIGAAVALGTGHPVGREGPAVHLGAAISSWFGAHLGLPFSTQRLLVGCGSAAAIAALFNLPLAGILFAMEVILLEYNLIGFTAIIISAVSADTLTQMLLGEPTALVIATDKLALHLELPLLALLSVSIALGGWIFQEIQLYATADKRLTLRSRFLLSGLLIGTVALIFPEILRPIHEVTYEAIKGDFDTKTLLSFALIYLCLTPIILGLGIPGGVIGPALALGSLTGALISILFNSFGAQTELSVYALIGMAAMMSAIIHAPLAALIAVFELSSDTHTLAAAMMVIVVSDLIMRAGFGKPSIFEGLLASQGLSLNTRVYRRVMMSTNVMEVVNPSFVTVNQSQDKTSFRLLVAQSEWVLREENRNFFILRGGKNSNTEASPLIPSWDDELKTESLQWKAASTISAKASLLQCIDLMKQSDAGLVIIQRRGVPVGVITEKAIYRFYQERAE